MRLDIKRLDWTFPGLVAFLLLANMPFFSGPAPAHDTGYSFRIFYYLYNELLTNGEIPRWLPYGSYGLQSDAVFNSQSPMVHFVSLVGAIFGAKDILFLFKTALFLEQFTLLLGMYLLSRAIFTHRAAVVAACLSAAGATVLLTQIYQNFRVYYLLPLAIYFIVLFFRHYRPRHLMLAALVSVMSFGGIGTYLIVLPVLCVSTVFSVLLAANVRSLRRILDVSAKEILISSVLFLMLIATLSAYYLFISGMADYTVGFTPGRNPDYTVTLDTFLTYDSAHIPRIGFQKFLGLVYPYETTTKTGGALDCTLYVGLIPFALSLYGIWRARSAVPIAFSAIVVLLALFSLGGRTPVAEALYNYFPFMKYYRHIGYAVASFKIFLPLLAGFGLDQLLRRNAPIEKKDGGRTWLALSLEAAMVLAVLAGGLTFASVARETILNPRAHEAVYLLPAAVPFAALFFWKRLGAKKRFAALLVLCVALEMLNYQSLMGRVYAPKKETYYEVFVNARKTGYQPVRKFLDDGKRTNYALYYLKSEPKYVGDFNFLQWDPCFSTVRIQSNTLAFRMDIMNVNVAELLKVKGVLDEKKLEKISEEAVLGDRHLLSALGCETPKLKVSSDVFYAEGAAGAEEAVKADRAEVVLLDAPSDMRIADAAKGGGTVKVLDYKPHSLRLNAYVDGARGAWLYYADAWHPDWRATVNGRPAQIIRANLAFKAVRLEKGANEVEMVFDNAFKRTCRNVMIAASLVFTALVLAAAIGILLAEPRQ